MSGLFYWIFFGLVVGTVAKLIHPGRDPGGCIMTILIGIGGAVVGGFIGTTLGIGRVSGWSLGSMALAVVGAVIVLVLYQGLFGKGRRGR